eukprot:c3816_g1_i1.p1 GENE.c3816_g1_i1~~c3816_g1_i1.p1  ORF type:complete len:191 (-),score=30.95 c3816_g1_i1:41-613(-)
MAHLRKIQKEKPDQLEVDVAKALVELELNLADIRPDLAPLKFISAREVDVSGTKKAIVIVVPFVQLQQYRKIQSKLIRELEKKFSGKHVVLVGNRRILKKETKTTKIKRQQRPYSRTVTAVHAAILEDLTFPIDIVKKRTRVRSDTSKLLKIYLDPKEQANVEGKLDTFTAVYKRLTGKDATFEFPAHDF